MSFYGFIFHIVPAGTKVSDPATTQIFTVTDETNVVDQAKGEAWITANTFERLRADPRVIERPADGLC